MNFPKSGPLTIAVGIPTINPTRITHPRSAFRISATATGPGVGGIKACVIANPASSGIAYKSMDFFVFRCREYTNGIKMIKATSKKTGIAIKKPVIISAQEAFFSPNFCSKYCAKASAPPECSRIAPNIAPSPTTTATKPRVEPIPSFTVTIISVGATPARIPTKILEISKARKG